MLLHVQVDQVQVFQGSVEICVRWRFERYGEFSPRIFSDYMFNQCGSWIVRGGGGPQIQRPKVPDVAKLSCEQSVEGHITRMRSEF